MTNPIKSLRTFLRAWPLSVRQREARRAAVEQWRLSEERLRFATEAGRLGLWDWDIAGERVSFTGSLYELHGIPQGEIRGNPAQLLSLIHPDDRRMVLEGVAAALRNADRYEAEFRGVWPSGEEGWIYVTARVVRQRGHAVRLAGASVDIDARKRVELALRESEERFAKAFDASPMALALYSLDTSRLIEANETFCELSGYRREEVIGRTADELDLWPTPEARMRGVQAVHETESLRNLMFRFCTRMGEERTGLLSSERIVIGGRPHVLAVIQDITDREQALAALRESERRLRLVLRAANAGVWEIDMGTGETFWSDEFRDLYGYEKNATPDQSHWGERLHPDDLEPMSEDFRKSLASGLREFHREFRIVHPTRGVRWMHTSGNIDRDADGNITKLRGISLDITPIKEAEQELRDADRRKNEFLAVLAHELRNPLAPISNGLEILRLADSRDVAERARIMMERQLQQMVHLIDDLLEVSRISQGKIQLDRKPVELSATLQSAIDMSKPLIESAGHELSIDMPPHGLVVNGDATRLAQVFGNLLNNAAKYTNPGGHIWLTVKELGDQVSVTVRDNGIGIDPQMLSDIFEMFVQVERPEQRDQGGLGIGLGIARRLVEMHGGRLEARSQGRGMGSEFTVWLPLHVSAGSAPEADIAARPEAAAHALRVLVVDDNTDAAMSLALILKIGGHTVLTAYDGEHAVRIAESFHPDVAFLDIGMPGMDGYEVCRRLRALPGGKQMLIVALTGWGQAEDKERSRKAGFDRHLVKPAELRTLENLLNDAQRSAHPPALQRKRPSHRS